MLQPHIPDQPEVHTMGYGIHGAVPWGKKSQERAAATKVILLASTGTPIKKTPQTITSNSFFALHEQKQGNQK